MSNSNGYSKENITAVILAGGRATRMGGQDKALMPLHGKPAIEYILDAIRPQVSTILINANRNQEQYREYGYPVIEDIFGDYLGPLIGLASGLQKSDTEYVVTIPCDSPLIPDSLVRRLYDSLQENHAELSVVHDGERMQPLFALLRQKLLPDLLAYLEKGERKVHTWCNQHKPALADFSDLTQAFMNVNTAEDLAAIEAYMK